MKIFDCFSYWDEDLLLEIRLNILNDFIDYFVIVEGNKTWQNNPKKLRFDLNKFKLQRLNKVGGLISDYFPRKCFPIIDNLDRIFILNLVLIHHLRVLFNQ